MFEKIKQGLAGIFVLNSPADQENILGKLHALYADELNLAAQFRAHAERLYYPQYRERLEVMAGEKQQHVESLRKKIVELGGPLPNINPTIKDGRNDYERLLHDLEDEKLLVSKYLHTAYEIDDYDRDTADLLLKIREKEKDHEARLTDIFMRTDRYGI